MVYNIICLRKCARIPFCRVRVSLLSRAAGRVVRERASKNDDQDEGDDTRVHNIMLIAPYYSQRYCVIKNIILLSTSVLRE